MADSAPIAPRADPWFRAPAGFESERPGAVLRVRIAQGNLPSQFASAAGIYNVMYRTTDSLYQPSFGVTTFFVPKSPADAHALLSYTIPYNSCDIDAGPSFLLHRVSKDFWYSIIENVDQALEQGRFVSLPDHWGQHAACGDGIIAGHTTIDSIRSVLRLGFGLDRSKARIGLWGYSGGAVAAAWAAQLQPHYAPELELAGAALGGIPSDFRCLIRFSGTPFAGAIPQLLIGITALHPKSFEYVVSQLKPEHKENFLACRNYDIATAFQKFAGQNIFDYFKDGEEIFTHPLVGGLLLSHSLLGYHGIPKTPLFFYQAINDELAPIHNTDVLVQKWGQVGVNIVYERNTECKHMDEAEASRPRAEKFLDAVMSGTYAHKGLTIRDVTAPLETLV